MQRSSLIAPLARRSTEHGHGTRAMTSSRAMLLQWMAMVCAAHTAIGTVKIVGEVSFDLRVADRDEDNDAEEIQKMLQKIKSGLHITDSLQSDSVELKKMLAKHDSDFAISDVDDAEANTTRNVVMRANITTGNADNDEIIMNVTAAPQASCDYQFPERRQTNAMLSNMMNQLTKVSNAA